ncbi:MAG TPA: hypothetical protein VL981_07290 [Candidatus Methylacidiphilales bacterium]|nr:hypothetical protein [Candidatus Methylacidiphilales bacterium]
MGKIDDSLAEVAGIEDMTERAFQMAGLVSTLFKIKGIALVVTGRLAFNLYTNATSENCGLELAPLNTKLTTRVLQEVMAGQLHARGLATHWILAGVAVDFQSEVVTGLNGACRDLMTDHGVVKLFPAEELTAERIVASVHPVADPEAETQVRLLLTNALSQAFVMDWAVLQTICHLPEYRVGEELSQLRMATKHDIDTMGTTPGPDGQTPTPGEETPPATEAMPVPDEAAKPKTKSAMERAQDAILGLE